jgi:ABC-2 type transport system ATP-binding protein/lipopolysaccharide transport system ATP-binding protein
MVLRLSFAVATCFKPELLLMDEWILAGDAHFMEKAEARVKTFIERASVMVLASHDLALCSRWCTVGVWLDQGQIRDFGPIDEIIMKYTESVPGTQQRRSLPQQTEPIAPMKNKLT